MKTVKAKEARFKIFLLLQAMLFTCILHAQGFLKAKDQYIINGKGEKVILRGMGLGGWELQEGYMFHVANLGQQYRIREKIADVVGKEKAAVFYDSWLHQHTTKADIDSFTAWGFNSVRLPMHYNLYTLPVEEEPVKDQNTWLQKGFALTDSLLKWCQQNHMYLILDLHATPGGQGNDLPISDRNPLMPSLWESKANQGKMIALWKKLAERYAGEEWIGGYDIINEPNWGFEDEKDKRGTAEKKNGPFRQLMMDVTKAIREVDKNHIIIIEGNGFGNNYNGILPAWDDNMVLSFHKYGNFNTVNAIKSFLDLRSRCNIPLWLGESGENSNTWFTEAIRLVESNGIGWSWWPGKKMGFNNPLEIRQPKNYDVLLNYWSGKRSKPTTDEAWKILDELLMNIQIKNNIIHHDVIDAMFRQVQSNATKPFKNYSLNQYLTIPAIDFDLGRQGSAYHDNDSASYQYTPGVNTKGNKGYQYRNDGVDIDRDSSGYFVFSIEDGEWMQYSIDVKKKGVYQVSFEVASINDEGKIILVNNGKIVTEASVQNTGSLKCWQSTTPTKIELNKGMNRLIVHATKGGFNLKQIQITNP